MKGEVIDYRRIEVLAMMAPAPRRALNHDYDYRGQ
jgi:hypothetical protein